MSKPTRLFDYLKSNIDTAGRVLKLSKRDQGGWKLYDKNEIIDIVDNISKGLIAKGIKKGDRIGLMSGNRPEWNFVDFACNQLGVALVPLYPTLSAQDLSYIVKDAEAKLIFVSNKELAEKVEKALANNDLHL